MRSSAAARAQLKASEAQVKAREAEAAFAETTNERWRDSPKGVVSEQERESKKADYDGAAAGSLRRQGAGRPGRVAGRPVHRARRVQAGHRAVRRHHHRAPHRHRQSGDRRQHLATTPLYHIAQNDPLRVFVDVPQSAAAELMPRASRSRSGRPAPHAALFAGKIARAAQAINVQARTMRVEVDLPNADAALVPGMYVNVAFRLGRAGGSRFRRQR